MNIKQHYEAAESRYENSEVLYERCGRSGVLLPKVSLGFWHNFGGVDPYERSRAITHYAFDHGITHFDLANNYGPPYGTAEETMGRLMDDDFRPYRDELFISSKAGYDMWPGPYGNWGSRKYLMASLDQSLRRMHIDYVDLFYSHRFDPNTPIEETAQALVDIVRSGKALYAGISNWPLEPLKIAERYLREHDVPLLIYQGRLNMIDRVPQETGITAFCKEQGIGFISYSPLAQGLLTDRYLNGIPQDSRMARNSSLPKERLTPELLSQLNGWQQEAVAQGQTMAEKALRWVLQQEGVTSVLVGASSVEQLEKNLITFSEDKQLSDAQMATLLDVADKMVSVGTVPCTACHYCVSHCPQGLDIPHLISLYNEHAYTGGGFIAPMALSALPEDKLPQACLHCQSCEQVCPQQIGISEVMEKFSALLG